MCPSRRNILPDESRGNPTGERERERERKRERGREGGREGAAVTIIAAVKYSSGVPIPTARQRVLKHLSSAFEIVSFGRVLFLESVAR